MLLVERAVKVPDADRPFSDSRCDALKPFENRRNQANRPMFDSHRLH
jgi:hypothetical protein